MESPDPLLVADLQPGQVLVGRYRLAHQLGSLPGRRVWRAQDLARGGPVALAIVEGDAEGRAALIERLRTLGRLRHPAARQVLDVVEADGRVYCALELVNGESLRTLVRRAGRFPPEKVVEIGRQLCAAVISLHAAGIGVPLDPAAILLDDEGFIRLVDAGFVAAEPEPPPAAAVATVLYELLRPSTLATDGDRRLETVLLDALGTVRAPRSRSVLDLAAALDTLHAAPRRSAWRRPLLAAAAVAMVAALAGVGAWLAWNRTAPVPAHDTIVLADFENTTGEPVFDGALKVALSVALEQSPFLRVFPEERARQALRLMQRGAEPRITPALARDIARRERLKALVAGAIEPSAGGYRLRLEARDANTGAVIAHEEAAVAAREAVLTALGETAARLRARLGESLSSIERFDTPLPEATTASLEALHAYAQALDDGRVVPRPEAIPHLQRAIALDPGFALAQAALSGVYRNTGRSAEAPAYSARAFELRDRVSERERFFISWRYYVDASHEWDKALELSTSWTQTYPREPFAFNSLGLATAAFGEHEPAVRAFREAIRLDPGFIPPHGNLAGSLIALNQFDEARSILAQAQDRGIAFITVRRMAYLLAFIAGDVPGMARELDLIRRSSDAVWASVFEARTAAFDGRGADAHARYAEAAQWARDHDAMELAGQWTAEDAEVHALAGDCDTARGEVETATALSADSFTLERAARTLAWCGDGEGVARVRTQLTARFPTATLIARIQLPVVAAAELLRAGDPARALDALAPVMAYDQAPSAEFWPSFLRAEAYRALGNDRAAREQFQSIVDRRGQGPTSPLYKIARQRLGRE